MVIVTGWMQNVGPYPNSRDIITTPPKMAARAVLICRPNSHPFQERSLVLDQPVKIGRSVARARAAQNNAIFDCKVLSRNHALLWYENGKFYLQDTKSSNGTFVNNQRLSKSADESPPREVCSGDIVQFGVDVMENARKVTHGCIVATLKLYLPDGKEAKASSSTSVVSSIGVVPLEDLYQLNQYLQDALQREQLLENKLATMQRLMETTRQASDRSWRALIDEDRLLSRVEILESQLLVYSKNYGEDKLREELRKLQEDKSQYLGTAKESLRRILQEKLDAITKLADLERTLSNTEDEVDHLKDMRERSQQELQELAHKYTTQLQKVEDLASKLQETEEQHREICERLEQEKRELSAQVEDQLYSEAALQARLDAVTKDSDLISQRQRALLQTCLNNSHSILDMKENSETMKETDSTGTQVDLILEKIVPDRQTQDYLKDAADNIKFQLQKTEDALQESHAEVRQLYVKLEDARSQEDSLLDNVHQLEENLAALRKQVDKTPHDNSQTIAQVNANQNNKLKAEVIKLEEALWISQLWVDQYSCMVVVLKELLSEARNKAQSAEEQVLLYQKELENVQQKVKSLTEEATILQQQHQVYQFMAENKSDTVGKLHETIKRLTFARDQLQLEVHKLEEKLQVEVAASRHHSDESERLRKQLVEVQQCVKQGHNEAEKMKDRLNALQAELDARINGAELMSDNKDKEEVQQLSNRCMILEAENLRLRAECVKLNKQCSDQIQIQEELEALKSHLSSHPIGNSLEEVDELKNQRSKMTEKVNCLEEELVLVKERYAKCNDEQTRLIKELEILKQDGGSLLNQTYAALWCGLVPFIIVFLGIILAFYPTLSFFMGTADSPLQP
ncbi:sarcolemmal membrane-associated protein isoform X2 [Schistocerca serialis cubense]|nr:sarcolemmal membrane-associated protein isoform X2 [Schistocerca serialis cubense]XP_049955582.1 sarcolemmal membrane-associated protein isoform X2 [Schistocerca serialis cubense]